MLPCFHSYLYLYLHLYFFCICICFLYLHNFHNFVTGGRFNTLLCAFCVTCSGSLHRAAYCSPDFHQQAINKVIIKTIIRQTRNSQDEVEGDEAGGRPQALHRPLLPRLPLHLHDVRPHAQACHAKIGVSSLCPGSVFFLALAKYKY